MNKNRICLLDEIRGILIILMVGYHLIYSAYNMFNIEIFKNPYLFIEAPPPLIGISFILVSGIAFNLSSNNQKRGFQLLAIALIITLVTALFLPEQIIWFGILHLLSVSIIFCSGIKNLLDKIPAILGIILSTILFFITYNISKGYLGFEPICVKLPEIFYSTDSAMMFGFYSKTFYSSDYFPLLPYFFMFTNGIFLGRHINKLPEALKKQHIKPLAFIGRHSLIIYILHQPIIIAILYIITTAFN